jgi:hypothetical protein
MDARAENNNYCLGPVSFSNWVAAHERGNWGEFLGAFFQVTFDPQVDTSAIRLRGVKTFSPTRRAGLDFEDVAGALIELAGGLAQVQLDQVLRELGPDEDVPQPSIRDLRHSYRRYDVPG